MYPFVIYADFESCLIPVNNEQVAGTTHAVAEHIPSGFCAYIVCNLKEKNDADFSRYATEPVFYSGLDAMNVFYNHINTERRRISRLLDKNVDMTPLTHDEQDYFDFNLKNKVKYVAHLKNVQLYLRLGMKLGKIHRVLTFTQSDWMKS